MDKEEQIELSLRDLLYKKASLEKFEMKDRLKGYKSSEVHFIDYIGRNADSNVTKLANSFYVTRGAISKISKKLMKRGLIESFQKPDNRKEIYFRLTEQGNSVYKIHEELHKEFQERDKDIFEQVTEEQINSLLRFLEMYSNHLDAEIQKLGADITSGTDFE